MFLGIFELKRKSASKPRATNSFSFSNLAAVLSAEPKCSSYKSKTRFSFTHKSIWVTSEVQFRRLQRSQAILFICLVRVTF